MSLRTTLSCAAAAAALVALAAAAPAAAQGGGGARQNTGTLRRPAPPNYVVDLKVAAETVAKQYETRIVVDPALFVAARPTAPAANVSVEQAVAALAAQARGGAWRRVYIKQAGAAASPDKLVAAVRALEALEQAGVVVEDTASQRATYFSKGFPVTGTFADDLAAQQFSKAPIYVIYSSVAGAGASTEERFAALTREQMDMMMRMTPEQLTQAMQQSMQMFMNMDPAVRGKMMGTMMQSGMQMFQAMSPEQRQELINQAMQNAQSMFGAGGPTPPGPGR